MERFMGLYAHSENTYKFSKKVALNQKDLSTYGLKKTQVWLTICIS